MFVSLLSPCWSCYYDTSFRLIVFPLWFSTLVTFINCPALYYMEVALNKVHRRIWYLTSWNHTGIVHCVANLDSWYNLVYRCSNSLHLLSVCALKFFLITGGRCWVAYMPSHIFSNRRRGVSKFVDCKELHFKLKANCGSQCGILTDCFGSYCIYCLCLWIVVILYTSGKYQYFPPNWLIFPSKLDSSGYVTLGMPFILWLPMILQ